MSNDVISVIFVILLIEMLLYVLFSSSNKIRGLFEKLGLEIQVFTVLIKRRSALDILNKISGRKINMVLWFGLVAMIISMIIFYYGVYILGIDYVFNLLRGFVSGESTTTPPPITPIIPGVTITGVDIIYILVAIGIAIALHELGHAIAAKVSGVDIKSYGAGIFLIIPFAFVEIDEEKIKINKKNALKILSAGILMNIFLFIISFLLIILIINVLPFIGVIQGAVISQVEPNSPAYEAGIRPGLLIVSINSTPVYTLDNFLKYRPLIVSGKNVDLYVVGMYPNGSYIKTIIHKPANATRIGVVFDGLYIPLINFFLAALVKYSDSGYTRLVYLEELIRLLVWINIINISLAVINAGPIYITDGGKFLSMILPKKLSDLIQIATVSGFVVIFVASFIRSIS
ncbi:MAG: site-2 protease family protein [Sulfolobales archaeon]